MIRRRSSPLIVLSVATAVLLARPSSALAQTRPGRIELSALVNWTAGFDMATADSIQFDRAGREVTTFTTEGRLDGAVGYGGRFAVLLSDRLAAEATAVYSSPALRVDAAGDIEQADAGSASEHIHQYAIEGAAVYYFQPRRARTRLLVLGGAGYLRELHEGQTLGANGQTYFAGGGLVRELSATSKLRLAMRLDARVVVRTNGVATDGGTHVAPVAAGSLIIGF